MTKGDGRVRGEGCSVEHGNRGKVRREVAKLRRGELRPHEGGEEPLGLHSLHDVHSPGWATSLLSLFMFLLIHMAAYLYSCT